MKSEVLIKAQNLSKKYGDFVAVNSIDFAVFKGECCGFLDPNGAGANVLVLGNMLHCNCAQHRLL
jgi:ABC-2 type transport system ATP-binding protein